MPRKRPKVTSTDDAGVAGADVIDLRRFQGIEVAWDVVLVEDNPAVQRLVEATLGAAGFNIVSVVDRAEDVFPVLLGRHPDVVILDDELAGPLRGSEAAARIKMCLPTAFVLLYTASPPAETPAGVDLVCEDKTPKALLEGLRAVLG